MLKLFKVHSDELFVNVNRAIVEDRDIVLVALKALREELIWNGDLNADTVVDQQRALDEIINIENQMQ